MRHKGFCILALIAVLGAVAGCGTAAEDTPEKAQEGQVTEALQPAEEPSATATPEPTATPAPTATPLPANYMEKNGIEILGEGSFIRKGFIANVFDENGNPVVELADCEYSFDVVSEEREGGTKIIRVTVNKTPYVSEAGSSTVLAMGGFVDLKTGKAFSPYPDELHTTLLKRGEESFEIQFDMEREYPSVTHPYYTERYTLVCPSDYEDAGFYITGWDLSKEPYIERFDTWRMINFIRHGESDMVVFGVSKGLETVPEKKMADGALLAEENYFEKNGLTTKGEGAFTYLGTEESKRWNNESGSWETVSVEKKEIESEFYVTEEQLGDGRKCMKGAFTFVGELHSTGEASMPYIQCGIADRKTGLVYPARTYDLAEPYLVEKDGKEMQITVGVELNEEVDGGKIKAVLSFTLCCPEEYEDAVFYLTGDLETRDAGHSNEVEVYSLNEIDHGDCDLLFFR